MWHNWQAKPTSQRDAMTEDDAKHEARRLTEHTGRIHIPVYTCDGWAVQRVETVSYAEQANSMLSGGAMTIRESVTAILDSSTGETFSLWGLTDRVGLAVGWRVMPHTVRRACKLYADRAGGEFYCVDPVHGQYRYVPGVKIGGAIFD